MFLADYHVHTNNSFDSKSDMHMVCQQVINQNVQEICFTEHFSVNPKFQSYGHMNFDTYFAEIESCRDKFGDKLNIKAGLELCDPYDMKDEYQTALQQYEIDFLLGSVHHVDEVKLNTFVMDKSPEEVFSAYYQSMYRLAAEADVDVLAHFDFIKRYATGQQRNHYRFEDYEEMIEGILKKAIERGIGIEINMAGYHHIKLEEAYPTMDILKLYRSLGGEIITIGSDAHLENMAGFDLDIAMKMLQEAGFDYVFTFEARKPKANKLTKTSTSII